MQRLVVVGASLAGLRAAQAARAAGFDGELVMIGAESHRPYTRPPLSKELLQGAQEAADCELNHATLNAQWRLGTPAAGLDRGRKRVVLADGDEQPYDRVIIATGARAREWPGEVSAQAPRLFTLRSVDDALALRGALSAAASGGAGAGSAGAGGRLLIVGAGFIGCEVAASARKLGLAVTVLDIAPQPMLPLGPELGRRCAQIHAAHGVDLRLSTGVAQLHAGGARLTDGSEIDADVVLIALGAAPNIEWLRDSGLELNRGVVCDATLTAAGDPDVLAAGDLASWPHPLAEGGQVRGEHWTTAAEHGQLAGRNALLEHGQRAPHEAPPYFWSDQYEVKIQAVGFPALAQRLEIIECTLEQDRLVAVGARDGRLVGVVAFNAAKRLAWYRRQLARGPELAEIRALVAADDAALGAPVAPGAPAAPDAPVAPGASAPVGTAT